jgi:formamidopyrimidine-DNA glycosylase
MPELPEVEHARRRVLSSIGGQTIVEAGATDTIVVTSQSLSAWKEAIVGRKVVAAARTGKNLIVELSGGHAIWVHLGMTGHLSAIAPGDAEPRFTRWWLGTAKTKLFFVDPRRLGRSFAGPADAVARTARLEELGPDAASIETGDALRERLASARGPIKAALMDQTRIAGIGNILASEALWRAKIHPEAPASGLRRDAFERLARGIADAIAHSLASMRDDEDIVYVNLGGVNTFRVYDREGEPCPHCGAKIVREVARGRSSYLCPRCQRKPR